MARQIIQQLVDDVDGSEIPAGTGGTIRFGVDGATYEIDLTDENAAALRTALAPYVTAGRRTSTTKRSAAGRTRSTRDLDAIRAWARENGHQVSDRGRVPVAVLAAYDAH